MMYKFIQKTCKEKICVGFNKLVSSCRLFQFFFPLSFIFPHPLFAKVHTTVYSKYIFSIEHIKQICTTMESD